MIKLIIFDWDDVFTVGSKEGYFRCYHETLVELGIALPPEEEKKRILARWGKPHREELRELLKEKPSYLNEACRICEKKLFSETFLGSLSVIKGTIELLQRLHARYLLCVATGLNPIVLKKMILPKFGFPPVFSQILSSYDVDDAEKQKPHPFMIHRILEAQRIDPEDAVFVGDAKADVLMARAAGVTPVVVLTGHLSKREAEELDVRHIIEDVTHIEEVLSELSDL